MQPSIAYSHAHSLDDHGVQGGLRPGWPLARAGFGGRRREGRLRLPGVRGGLLRQPRLLRPRQGSKRAVLPHQVRRLRGIRAHGAHRGPAPPGLQQLLQKPEEQLLRQRRHVLLPHETSDASAGQSWCYVSNECLSLNGGTFATNQLGFALGGWNNLQSTSNLSWKVCDSSGADSILKDKTMDELIEIGRESDVSMAMLLRYAYPAVSITYGEARDFLETLSDAGHWNPALSLADNVNAIASPPSTWGTRLPFVYTTLSSIVTSEQGTILDSPGHRDEFHVVIGREVWEVKRSDEGNMAYLAGKFYLEFDVACVLGCAPAAREAPLDLLTQ
ncbi:unnamed protein product [Prorocentrum cordatum]|uniref:Uncharacterized protein n=1 Tax=Prorocentrum cordatum TaxID=2364126 RepID=A0ABN9SPN0_9DINO|nr:unnamed protein product [Polarella glacialis]